MDIVDDYSEITIDILICGYTYLPNGTVSPNSITNMMTSRAIHGYYASTNNVEVEERAYPGVNYRFYF